MWGRGRADAGVAGAARGGARADDESTAPRCRTRTAGWSGRGASSTTTDPIRRRRPTGAGNAGPAAPAHGPADRQLVVRGRDRASRQRRVAAFVRPGQLNIMTAGHGIAHSEVSTPDAPPIAARRPAVGRAAGLRTDDGAPAFDAYADLPALDFDGAHATVMIGTVAGVTSPAPTYTPLVGADITIDPGRTLSLPLTPSNEYAVLIVDGSLRSGTWRRASARWPTSAIAGSRSNCGDLRRRCPLPPARRRAVRGGVRDVVELHRPFATRRSSPPATPGSPPSPRTATTASRWCPGTTAMRCRPRRCRLSR